MSEFLTLARGHLMHHIRNIISLQLCVTLIEVVCLFTKSIHSKKQILLLSFVKGDIIMICGYTF